MNDWFDCYIFLTVSKSQHEIEIKFLLHVSENIYLSQYKNIIHY